MIQPESSGWNTPWYDTNETLIMFNTIQSSEKIYMFITCTVWLHIYLKYGIYSRNLLSEQMYKSDVNVNIITLIPSSNRTCTTNKHCPICISSFHPIIHYYIPTNSNQFHFWLLVLHISLHITHNCNFIFTIYETKMTSEKIDRGLKSTNIAYSWMVSGCRITYLMTLKT